MTPPRELPELSNEFSSGAAIDTSSQPAIERHSR
jgi:hypothetical protein